MRTRTAIWSVLFYAFVTALLLGSVFQWWHDVLPHSLAARIGHNSEGYAAVLAVAPWIQFVRPRLSGRRAEWPVTLLVGVTFAALTLWLVHGHLDSHVATLNEGTLAAAVLIPYVQVRRPLPRRLAAGLTALLLVLIVVTNRTGFTTDFAETWGMAVLAVVGFDLVDRGILDPAALTSRTARALWYAFLVVAPTVFSIAEYHLHVGATGWIGEPVRWLVRIVEAFVFALFTEVYFAVLLGYPLSTVTLPSTRRPAAARRAAAR